MQEQAERQLSSQRGLEGQLRSCFDDLRRDLCRVVEETTVRRLAIDRSAACGPIPEGSAHDYDKADCKMQRMHFVREACSWESDMMSLPIDVRWDTKSTVDIPYPMSGIRSDMTTPVAGKWRRRRVFEAVENPGTVDIGDAAAFRPSGASSAKMAARDHGGDA